MSLDNKLLVRIDTRTKERFDAVAQKNGTTASELTRSLIEAVLENRLVVSPRTPTSVRGVQQ